MTAEAAIWTPELWTPGIGWRPRPLPKFNLRTWRKAKEDALTRAVTRVQGVGQSGTTAAVTATIAQPGSTSLLVAVVINGFGGGTDTITMSTFGGASWTTIKAATLLASTNYAVFAIKNPGTGTAVTANTANAGVDMSVLAMEFSGLTLSTPAIDGSVVVATGTPAPVNSGNLVTTNANDLLIGFSWTTSNFTISFPGAPWANDLQRTIGTPRWITAEQSVAATGTYSFPGGAGSGTPQQSAIVAFKIDAGVSVATKARSLSFASVAGRASNR